MASPRQRARISRAIQYAILAAAAIALVVMADWQRFGETFVRPESIAAQFPEVITVAFKNTIVYAVLAFAVGLAGGILLAFMRTSSVGPYRWIAGIYTEIFRGLPALLVFVLFGYGIPAAFAFTPDIFATVMLALGMVSAAYIAETIRAGLQAVPPGQLEAARSLGMSPLRANLSIVFPQAFRIVLPPLTNELIQLTKDTSLVYLLGLTVDQYELTKFGREGLNDAYAGLTPLLVSGVLYLVITIPLGWLARRFERSTAQLASTKGSADD